MDKVTVPLSAKAIKDIRYVGLRFWCANQNPPLEYRDIEQALCNMALSAAPADQINAAPQMTETARLGDDVSAACSERPQSSITSAGAAPDAALPVEETRSVTGVPGEFCLDRTLPADRPASEYKALYHELLYQVGKKHPGESRHETALRYLRNAETSGDSTACKATGSAK